MYRSIFRARWLAISFVALAAAVFFYSRSLKAAADERMPIYFPDSTITVKTETVNRTVYLPLVEIVRHLNLPYTDAVSLETFTIRGPNALLVLTRNSQLISINGQIVFLSSNIRRENQQWLVPVDFLSQGLSRVSGIMFRYRPGSSRVFAGDVNPSELVMNAQNLGRVTRLTIRSETPVTPELKRDTQQHRVVLTLGTKPIDPLRERLDYRDRLVQSIAFDDSDGVSKIIA